MECKRYSRLKKEVTKFGFDIQWTTVASMMNQSDTRSDTFLHTERPAVQRDDSGNVASKNKGSPRKYVLNKGKQRHKLNINKQRSRLACKIQSQPDEVEGRLKRQRAPKMKPLSLLTMIYRKTCLHQPRTIEITKADKRKKLAPVLRKPPEPISGETKIVTQNKREDGEFLERG
ncbi:hypothetical protein YC2023_067476 [Brassica napus]